jgi:hypothetical protein
MIIVADARETESWAYVSGTCRGFDQRGLVLAGGLSR